MSLTMEEYLAEMAYAIEAKLSAIWNEFGDLEDLSKRVQSQSRVVEDEYRQAESIQRFAESPDDVMLGVGRHWENYFGDDKVLHGMKGELGELRGRIEERRASLKALCGDLLQYGKQGISRVHGGLGACPPGRLVGTQPLKTVVWQGRNQAQHWEEQNPHQPVIDCFELLIQEVCKNFAGFRTNCMSLNLVHHLGWREAQSFRDDMLSLA